jgi:hypothetical protein
LAESRSGSGKTKDLVAGHHFPPNLLCENGSGLKRQTTNKRHEVDKLKLLLSEKIQIEGHSNNGDYIIPPCHDFNAVVRNFVECGGRFKTQKMALLIERTDPDIREIKMLSSRIARNPEQLRD